MQQKMVTFLTFYLLYGFSQATLSMLFGSFFAIYKEGLFLIMAWFRYQIVKGITTYTV